MSASPMWLEVLPVEVNGETRYGVMAVSQHDAGLGFAVFYGSLTRDGSDSDWGSTGEDMRNMREIAGVVLSELASGLPHG